MGRKSSLKALFALKKLVLVEIKIISWKKIPLRRKANKKHSLPPPLQVKWMFAKL